MRVINATMLTELFIKHVFSKHGVSNHITFDWRMEFVLKFFRSLAGVLNIKLHFISDYHLKTDSQIEYTNQTLEQFLRIYYNYQQSDWMLAYSHENLELNQGSCSERTQQSFPLDFPSYLYKYLLVCVSISCDHMTLTNNYIYLI